MYVASSIAEWELSAAQINPDPIRHEFERRLSDEWTAAVFATPGSITARGSP